jgi:hypothetical protein
MKPRLVAISGPLKGSEFPISEVKLTAWPPSITSPSGIEMGATMAGDVRKELRILGQPGRCHLRAEAFAVSFVT